MNKKNLFHLLQLLFNEQKTGANQIKNDFHIDPITLELTAKKVHHGGEGHNHLSDYSHNKAVGWKAKKIVLLK